MVERMFEEALVGLDLEPRRHESLAIREHTVGGDVRAGACAIATNSPISNNVATHTKQAPYRTYVVEGRVPRGSVPDALYWDTLDPYHYVRLQPADEQQD
jgi:hypothetical protein